MALQQSFSGGSRASVSSGTAHLTFSPAGGNLTVGNKTDISLSSTISTEQIDGIQATFSLSSSGNYSDITFTPTIPVGMRLAVNTKQISGSVATFQVVYLTNSPSAPYSNSASIALGTLALTPSAVGTSTLSFDQTLSKIASHTSNADILAFPQTYSFTLSTPAPSTTASATSTPTPTPTSTPSTGTITISNFTASDKTQTGITLTWTTSIPATSQVLYDLAGVSPLGSNSSLDATLTTNHSVTVSDLAPNTRYDFQAKSVSASGQVAVSKKSAFKTDNH